MKMRSIWLWAVGATLVFGLIGCGETHRNGVETVKSPAAAETSGEHEANAPSKAADAASGADQHVDKSNAAIRMPDVHGKRLTDAEESLHAVGITSIDEDDATGQDRIVLNSTNWLVQGQSPAPGALVKGSTAAVLKVAKPSDGAGQKTGVQDGSVPNVVCKDLQAAQDTMQSAGFYNLGSADGLGQGRMQLLDRNWVVVAQTPTAGTQPDSGTRVVLTAVKFGEPTGASGCAS